VGIPYLFTLPSRYYYVLVAGPKFAGLDAVPGVVDKITVGILIQQLSMAGIFGLKVL
jgi:hypothetical protein